MGKRTCNTDKLKTEKKPIVTFNSKIPSAIKKKPANKTGCASSRKSTSDCQKILKNSCSKPEVSVTINETLQELNQQSVICNENVSPKVKSVDLDMEKVFQQINNISKNRECSCATMHSSTQTVSETGDTVPQTLMSKTSETRLSKSLCACNKSAETLKIATSSQQILLPEVQLDINPKKIQTIQIDVKPTELNAQTSGVITIPVRLRFNNPCPARENKPCPQKAKSIASIPKFSRELVFETCDNKEYVCPECVDVQSTTTIKSKASVKSEQSTKVEEPKETTYTEPYLIDCASTDNVEIQTDLVLGSQLLSDSLNSVPVSPIASKSAKLVCKCGRDTSAREYINWNMLFLPAKDKISIQDTKAQVFEEKPARILFAEPFPEETNVACAQIKTSGKKNKKGLSSCCAGNNEFVPLSPPVPELLPPLVPIPESFIYSKFDYGSQNETYMNTLRKDEDTQSLLPWNKLLLPDNGTIRIIQKLEHVEQVRSSVSAPCICPPKDSKNYTCLNLSFTTPSFSQPEKSDSYCPYLQTSPNSSKIVTCKYLNQNLLAFSSKPEIDSTSSSCFTKPEQPSDIMKQDPVIAAFHACEAELKPVRDALIQVKRKLQNLNMPELDCLFNKDDMDFPRVKKECTPNKMGRRGDKTFKYFEESITPSTQNLFKATTQHFYTTDGSYFTSTSKRAPKSHGQYVSGQPTPKSNKCARRTPLNHPSRLAPDWATVNRPDQPKRRPCAANENKSAGLELITFPPQSNIRTDRRNHTSGQSVPSRCRQEFRSTAAHIKRGPCTQHNFPQTEASSGFYAISPAGQKRGSSTDRCRQEFQSLPSETHTILLPSGTNPLGQGPKGPPCHEHDNTPVNFQCSERDACISRFSPSTPVFSSVPLQPKSGRPCDYPHMQSGTQQDNIRLCKNKTRSRMPVPGRQCDDSCLNSGGNIGRSGTPVGRRCSCPVNDTSSTVQGLRTPPFPVPQGSCQTDPSNTWAPPCFTFLGAQGVSNSNSHSHICPAQGTSQTISSNTWAPPCFTFFSPPTGSNGVSPGFTEGESNSWMPSALYFGPGLINNEMSSHPCVSNGQLYSHPSGVSSEQIYDEQFFDSDEESPHDLGGCQIQLTPYSGQEIYERQNICAASSNGSAVAIVPSKRNKGIQKTGSLYKMRRKQRSASSVSTISKSHGDEDYIKPTCSSTQPKIPKRKCSKRIKSQQICKVDSDCPFMDAVQSLFEIDHSKIKKNGGNMSIEKEFNNMRLQLSITPSKRKN